MDTSQTPDIHRLSEREQEILRFVATGVSNKEIARQLYISTNTVKVHLRNVFTKIGVTTRTEAAMYAVRIGLVPAMASSMPIEEREALEQAEATKGGQSAVVKRWRVLRWVATVGLLLVLAMFGLGSRLYGSLVTPTATAIAPLSSNESRWHELADMPTTRSGLAAAAYEGQIYAIAGETAVDVTGVVERYETASNRWYKGATKPLPVADVSAAVIGGRIYVPGGRTASGNMVDVLEIYDPRLDAWGQGAPMPVAMSAYAMTAFEGRLYVFGGWDGLHYLNSVYVYSPEEDRWSLATPMPTARAFAGAAVAGGKTYVLGGYNGEDVLAVNEVYMPEREGIDDPWGEGVRLPEGRYAMGIVSMTDSIYLLGGKSKTDASLPPVVFVAQMGAWNTYEPPPVDTGYKVQLIPFGQYLYALGGETEFGMTGFNLAYQAVYVVVIPLVK